MQEARENTKRATGALEMRDSFGFREVGQDSKQGLVNEVFDKVARRYDLMNDLMSLGAHRLWKGAMVARLAPPRNRPWKCLDVAGGTGDIALRIATASRGSAEITVLDINASMLEVGAGRAEAAGLSGSISFVEGNAEALPFRDACFDAYTIAFGIRNVPRMDLALAEARRVLKHGGRFLCLEFSQVDLPLLDKAYAQWSKHVIPRIGEAVTGEAGAYTYLIESIAKFPSQARFAAMIREAGFARVDFTNMSGGIVALHSGWKL